MNNVQCSNCGAMNNQGVSSCWSCNAGLAPAEYAQSQPHVRCPTCGALSDVGASSCWACNASLAPGAGAGYVPPTHVPNHLVWAILVTLFCCVPFGIVSIVYASQVNGKLSMGDIEGAQEASGKAKMWALISLGSVFVLIPFWLVFYTIIGVPGL